MSCGAAVGWASWPCRRPARWAWWPPIRWACSSICPSPLFAALDADKVDASGEAYQYLKTPDAALGLASYGATLVLAGMGSDRRAEERPWIPLALAAKVGLDAVSAVYLTVEQGSKYRRFCSWCLLAAGVSTAMVPRVVPEARTAWGHLRSRTS